MMWRRGNRSLQRLAWPLFALGLGGMISVLVVQGRTRSWFALVALGGAVVLSVLPVSARFRLLCGVVVVSPILLGSSVPIPAELTLSQSLLILLVLAELLIIAPIGSWRDGTALFGLGRYLPFLLFALFGMISTYLNDELFAYWPTVCLVPLMLLFAFDRLQRGDDDTLWVLRSALAAIVLFVALVWIGESTGHAYQIGDYGEAWRFADARAISLGPVYFEVWSIRVGSLAALGVPLAIVLASRARSWGDRWMCIAALGALLAVLALTAARGAIIGAGVGAVLALLVSRRFRLTHIVFGAAALTVFLAILGPWLLQLLPAQGVARVAALGEGVRSISNFAYRVGVMETTFGGILGDPLGPGFAYLWERFRLDEAVAYTAILNGTGILGFLAFATAMLRVGCDYVARMLRRAPAPESDLAAIGLGTLAAAVLAGIASQSVFILPQQSFIFWAIVLGCSAGLLRQPGTSPETGPRAVTTGAVGSHRPIERAR